MSSRLGPRLQLAIAAALFSTGGAAIKLCTLGAWQVACFRSGIAAIVLLLFLREARAVSLRALPFAATYAATLVLFVIANKLTTAAGAIFLQSTAPFYVLLFAVPLLGERIRVSDLGPMLLVASGLALFFLADDTPSASAPDPARGNWLALASGLTYGLTVIGLRKSSQGGRDSSLFVVSAGNVLACLVCLPMALPVSGATGVDLGVLLFLGTIQIGLAYVLITRGFKRVPALEGSLILMIEPALNPLWAFWLQGEKPAALALIGGLSILAATGLKSWQDARRAPIG